MPDRDTDSLAEPVDRILPLPRLVCPDTLPVPHDLMANAVRALAMDAVERAGSGHPGMPMGMADVATVLVGKFLKFDAAEPLWPDRDRLVLSAGHGSMLLYALLYLTGYRDMTLDELKRFRQLHSGTPGHPEHRPSAGIETTTGPLGQGLSTAVGMALAERILAARFGGDLVDHHTYVFASDGDIMEGISHEAGSLAGHLGLTRLIVLYDDNGISIDGPTSLTFSDDTMTRFGAYGWHVDRIDGHDPAQIETAIKYAKMTEAPSLIACRTTIGFGAPTKAGTAAAHGAPLGVGEVAAARACVDWPHPPFEIPADVLSAWRAVGRRGQLDHAAWRERHTRCGGETPDTFDRALAGGLPIELDSLIMAFKHEASRDRPGIATRQSSGKLLDLLMPVIPELIGGSADLTSSNNTRPKSADVIARDSFSGRYIHFGVREHGMAAAMTGLALHGGLIPYGGTFLTFSDYCRPSIRLAALMRQRVIFVMTHDSIGLGEDGPTHQPVEHLAALRAIPNLLVFRPADAVETAECWQIALRTIDRPSVIVLTRQGVETVRIVHFGDNLSARGGYVLAAADGPARVTLIATGSEVGVALAARTMLKADGVGASVVSMPCWELFEQQRASYRRSTIDQTTLRVGIEAAVSHGWDRYLGPDGVFVGMPGFGESAPAGDLYEHFGITAERVVAEVRAKLL